MTKNSLLSPLVCLLFVVVGGAMVAGHFSTLRDGVLLYRSDAAHSVTITSKEIDRPARKNGIRGESVSVNGTRVRSLSTYFNSYLLTVSHVRPGGAETRQAPVSYDMWHDLSVGERLEVRTSPKVMAFVDASAGATLLHAFKQMGIGVAIILVGLAVLLLPKEEDST